jgi:hypothetical protein
MMERTKKPTDFGFMGSDMGQGGHIIVKRVFNRTLALESVV